MDLQHDSNSDAHTYITIQIFCKQLNRKVQSTVSDGKCLS